ncbi:MAG: hypothetical protein ACD_56C00110G0015 [uncultured bacterium]|nr:MAG: hypothetical protein ACD_56C00110G0015 [uncultured bacterium]
MMELMIVMAIVSIMAGALFVSVNKSAGTKDVENAAQQISTQLKTLQNEALTGKMIEELPAGSGIFAPACRFVFESFADSYNIKYDRNCSGIPDYIGGTTTVDMIKKKVKLDGHIIFFSSPRGEIAGSVEIVVTSAKDNSVKKYVNINSAGNISILDASAG